MLGAIIGDIAGSRFEWHNHKSKDFELLTMECKFTDDTVMSIAICEALMNSKRDMSDLGANAVRSMQVYGNKYPGAGYGGMFSSWLITPNPQPYGSFGNGAAMRVSACGFVASSVEEAKKLSRCVTEVTHNHPEGIKGAEAVAVAVYLAKSGESMLDIQEYITKNYYDITFKLDDIQAGYNFDVTCQGSVPQALEAFFESVSFEDAIRNAISIGGDSDTIAAITGGIAEAYYGIPTELRKLALTYLDETLLNTLVKFENLYPSKIEKIQNGTSVAFAPSVSDVKTGSREETMIAAQDSSDVSLQSTLTEEESISSQQLFNHLFEACNKIYGKVAKESYKSYIIPLLFFKRISDMYDEEYQTALDDSSGDKEYAAMAIHRFNIPDGCHWDDVRNATENIGTAIFSAMSGIEKANPDQLGGIFDAFSDATWTDRTRLPDATLKNLIEHMSALKFGSKNYSADCMGDAYEFLIKKFADLARANAGAFYTPRSVVDLLVRLLDPKPGESVYDPSCGTGGMLIGAINHMQSDKLAYGRIFGQEVIKATSSIARMNLFLHGASDFQIAKGDTLNDPKFIENGRLQKFDCVIANPPFSLSEWGAERFEHDRYGRNIWGTPSNSSADFAWIQHMVSSMKSDTGRCALIIAQGVLFHGGAEGKMRQQLIESDKLEAVITLPSGIFFSTGVNACILLLNNNKKAAHRGRVALIDASKIFVAKRAQNILTKENVDQIYNLYMSYQDVIDYAKIVTIADLRAKDYTLSVNSYIEKTKVKTASPAEVRRQYMEAYREMIECENITRELLKKGGYIDE